MKSTLPIETCDIALAQGVIGGKWKLVILWKLIEGRMRFSELRRVLPSIAEAVLISQLKELEHAGLVTRINHRTVPPRVEYEVTAEGRALRLALTELESWGRQYRASHPMVVGTCTQPHFEFHPPVFPKK
jgi:DNA-binding HxlR family transcriptional regulator